jgi:hypothetical protein
MGLPINLRRFLAAFDLDYLPEKPKQIQSEEKK